VRYSPYWSASYASSYYAAQVSALTLAPDTDYDAGTVIVSASPGTSTTGAPRLTVTPASAASHVRLVNRARTSTTGSTTTISVTRASGTNTLTVTGQVPLGHSAARKWVTVDDPALMTARALRTRLVAAGIRVDGSAVRGTTPAGQSLLARHTSMTLGQLLVPFLKLSNNGHAEAITKTLGSRSGRPGNWADGTKALRDYAARVGIPVAGLRFVDGSGLARANRLTPGQLATLLDKVQRTSWWPTFRAALPVAGTDPVRWTGGTLADRMRGTAAAGNLRAKNGSLTGVTSLAGYVTGADGRRYVFVMMSNYSGTSPRPVEDRLGVLLARWRMTNR
jgi:D-alanyl-D-alanine carboxypeptidase/D-alanyl-D-alanine-endopeptidase (penicillin-binding protein 4)